jgi:hypothetical protein
LFLDVNARERQRFFAVESAADGKAVKIAVKAPSMDEALENKRKVDLVRRALNQKNLVGEEEVGGQIKAKMLFDLGPASDEGLLSI